MQRLMPPAMLGIALLMVSRIPYPHVISHLVRGQKSFPQLVAIVFSVMALVAVRWYAVPALCLLYALWPALAYAGQWSWRRRAAMREAS